MLQSYNGIVPAQITLQGNETYTRFIQNALGLTAGADYPVMSTEGGVFTPESTSMRGHDRLPSAEAHAELMVKMFDWLEENSPLQAMMPWCIAVDDHRRPDGGDLHRAASDDAIVHRG